MSNFLWFTKFAKKVTKAIIRSLILMLRWSGRNLLSIGVWALPHGPHITRYAMYRELENICKDENQGLGKKVLSISQSVDLVKIIGLDKAEIVEANYPGHNFLKLEAFSEEQFDYIVSDQVLEHVGGNPEDAFKESFRVLKPEGLAVHTTCFIHPIHGSPSDYWRFTPEALRYLAKDFSLVITCGGWGNRCVWFIDWLGMRYTPVPHARWHPLHRFATLQNELWPVVTWIVARK